MATSVDKLRTIIRELQAIPAASSEAKTRLEELATAINKLERQRPFGPIVSEGSVTGAKIGEIDREIKKLSELGGAYKVLGREIRQALLNIKQFYTKTNRLEIPFGTQIPNLQQIYGGDVVGKVTGSAQDIDALFGGGAASRQATRSLEAALIGISSKYEQVGASLTNVKAHLDATNKAWSIQADVIKQTESGIALLTKKQMRVSSLTGAELEQTSLQESLRERLSPAQLERFRKQLQGMGMDLEHLNNVQIDAVNGVGRFSFKVEEANGAVKVANFHIDKWGRTLGDTSTRFRAFNDMITRNIGKVTQWALSVGLVFGAWHKLMGMMQDMVEIQDRLADMAIVSGQSMDKMSDYFTDVAAIAREAGTDVKDTLEGMALAMRAASGTDAERSAEALEILADSATFAKLSGLEMEEAVDIMISSLRQMGMALGDGDQLLNKWIATSKSAQVSLVDLGTAFATLATAAEGVGISTDELNALIATMAEVTKLSPQQTANSLRAMFSAIQMPSTQKTFKEFGIAIEDSNGRMRDLMDILTDVHELMQIYGDDTASAAEAMNKLGYAAGGAGARRQAQMVALLSNMDMVYQRIIVSEQAQGQVEDAMATKTDTLSTAVTNLNTAFSELAETLGTEGGMLELFTNMVETATLLVDQTKRLTEVTGGLSSSTLMTLLTVGAGLKFALPQRMYKWGERMDKAGMEAKTGGGFRMAMGTGIKQSGPSAVMGGLAGLGTFAATGDWQQAAGAGIGAAFGNYIGGPAGSFAGAVLGQAFVEVLQQEIPIIFADLGITEQPTIEALTPEELEKETRTRLFGPGIIGGIVEGIMGITPGFTRTEQGKLSEEDRIRKAMESSTPGIIRAILFGLPISPFTNIMGIAGNVTASKNQERLQELILEQERRRAEAARGEQLGLPEGVSATGDIAQRLQYYQQTLVPGLGQQMAERRKELPFEFAEGDIASAREYNSTVERTYSLMNQMLPMFYAYETSAEELGVNIGDVGTAFEELALEMVDWSDESLNFILDQSLALMQLQEEGKAVNDNYREYYTLLEGLRKQEAAKSVEQMGLPGFADYSEMSKEEFNQLIADARDLQAQFAEQLGIPDEVFTEIEDWAALVSENFEWVEGVAEQFVAAMKQQYDELEKAQEDAFNIQRLRDVDPSKMGQISQANQYWVNYLAQLKGMSAQQYLNTEGQQFNLVLGQNNVLQQLYSTNEAMLFTLQDIQDIEEKQLEGMWNIPTGATFWVPLTSMFYQNQQGENIYPELPELLPPTQQTAQNTDEIGNVNRMIKSSVDEVGNKIMLLAEINQETGDKINPETGLPEASYETGMINPDLQQKIADDLGNASNQLTTAATRLHETTGLDKRAFREADQMLTAPDINIALPEITGDFSINNVVTLDGRIIATYIARFVERAFVSAIRSNLGSNGNVLR